MGIKHVFRHLYRRKLYTAINILGLGIGLGCAILMATYIIHESSYDKYYKDSEQLYRVIDGKDCGTYYAMGEAFKEEVPEIEEVCRIHNVAHVKVKQERQYTDEKNLFLADENIIDMLDIEILNGPKEDIITNPNTIIISKSMADKYYSGKDAVGREIQLTIGQHENIFKITGIYKDIPSYSSHRAQFIGSIENAFSLFWDFAYVLGFKDENPQKDYKSLWDRHEFITYVKLNPNSYVKTIEDKCSEVCLKYREKNKGDGIRLQNIADIYMHSEGLEFSDYFLKNNYKSLRIFMGVGILILLVAIINFVLISNADNNLSFNEIACRKVNGASKKQIIISALNRSVITAFISLIPALLFVSIIIPVFNNLFDKDLHLMLFVKWQYVLILFGITLITGLSAGLYLGVYISGINPASLFQNRMFSNSKYRRFKGSLIVVQFIVFIMLSSCFLFMFKQYNYSLNKDLGFSTKNIIAVDMNEEVISEKIEYIRNQMLLNSNVIDCVPSSFTTPPSDNSLIFTYKNSETGSTGNLQALVFGLGVTDLLKIPIIDGRPFNESDGSFGEKFIINEAAAKKYDLRAGDNFDGFDIIGITKNFHYKSLHEPVKPIFIAVQTHNFHFMLIKTNGNNQDVINYARSICQELSPGFFMEYELLDDRIADFYKNEEKQMGTIGFFTAIALSLSCLGLLGFVSLSLVKKTKEIGIRKINGSKILDIIYLINKQYTTWIFIAFIISCPIAWKIINRWLENFAYRTEISWWIFVLSGMAALILAMVIVSVQSWLSALKNPVEALRYE